MRSSRMRLAVNIDHIATIREARKTDEPQPVAAAIVAELAGADGITVHLRGDRRHINEQDLKLLRAVVRTKLNVEMAATSEMIDIALALGPDQVTLVPERPQEVTTEGGLDVVKQESLVADAVRRLRSGRVRVSVFVDPHQAQIDSCRRVGADAIEINTGSYSASRPEDRTRCLAEVVEATTAAARYDLEVLAGHGLTYVNVRPIAAIDRIVELNIGHSIVSRAALVGMDRAVRDMIDALRV